MLRLIACSLLALVLTGCVAAPLLLGPNARPDVERAKLIAGYHKDAAGVACAEAILASLPAGVPPEPVGPLSLFMEIREKRRDLAAGLGEAVHNACAPLILDVQATLARLGLRFLPGGGALGGLMLPGR